MANDLMVQRMDLVKDKLATADFRLALQQAAPKGQDAARMIRGALTAMQVNPELFNCDVTSLKLSMMAAAQYGFDLAPALGECYLVPFRDARKGKLICTLIPGYKGMIKLALNCPKVLSVQPSIVYKNDKFSYSKGLNPTLEHVPANGDRGESTHFYCVVRMRGGATVFEAWSKEECLAHGKKYSKTFASSGSKWLDKKTQDSMCLKTVLRATLKFVPISATDPLAQMLGGKDEDVIDIPGAAIDDIDDGENGETMDNDDGDGHDQLPPNREYLKSQISKYCRDVPERFRAGINIPADLDDITIGTSELESIRKDLEAAADKMAA